MGVKSYCIEIGVGAFEGGTPLFSCVVCNEDCVCITDEDGFIEGQKGSVAQGCVAKLLDWGRRRFGLCEGMIAQECDGQRAADRAE